MKLIRFQPTIPKWLLNQQVRYKNKKGGISIGRITYLETHYKSTDGAAYHIYCIHTEGNQRSAWVSEYDIFENIP